MHTLIVGASLAGLTVARTLRALDPKARITVLGEEPHPPYDRPPLSKQMLLDPTYGTSTLAEPAWYDDQHIELLTGHRAVDFNAVRHVVHGEGWDRSYDQLVIATGAQARRLPAPLDDPTLLTLRTLDDSLRLRTTLQTARRLLVVGAGFIGLEVAAAARRLGVAVDVVDQAPVPLSAAVGAEAGHWFRRLHERNGVRLHLGRTVEGTEVTDRGCLVALDDGTALSGDTVLTAVGTVPNIAWTAGLLEQSDGAIRCGSDGRTAQDDVWAIGDAAAWYVPRLQRHLRIEHWATALEHGRSVAARLAGRDPEQPRPPSFWSDQYDAKVRFVGYPGVWDGVDVEHDDASAGPGSFFARYLADDQLVGALAVNRPRDLAMTMRELTANQQPAISRAALTEHRQPDD